MEASKAICGAHLIRLSIKCIDVLSLSLIGEFKSE